MATQFLPVNTQEFFGKLADGAGVLNATIFMHHDGWYSAISMIVF